MSISIENLGVDRDVYEVSYDTEKVKGGSVKATFKNTTDVSVYKGKNDGKFIVTVRKGYEGDDHVTVKGSHSGTDSGDVTFGG